MDVESGEILVPLVFVRPLAEENPLRTTSRTRTFRSHGRSSSRGPWSMRHSVGARTGQRDNQRGMDHVAASHVPVSSDAQGARSLCASQCRALSWPGPEKAPVRYKSPLVFRAGFVGSLSVSVCHVWHRRVLVTAAVRPLFGSSGQLRHLMTQAWVDYHRRLGDDQFIATRAQRCGCKTRRAATACMRVDCDARCSSVC